MEASRREVGESSRQYNPEIIPEEEEYTQNSMERGGQRSKTTLESIQEQLDKLSKLSVECCIYTVPKLLRGVNPEAYTPMTIQIGPLHQKNCGEDCSSGDVIDLFHNGLYKLKCLKSFLKDSKTDLESCLKIVANKKSDIQACYVDSLAIFDNDDLFSKMFLLDCVFIIQFLRNHMRPWDNKDSIWKTPLNMKEIERDIMLAENQLPLFILKDLYALAFPQHEPTESENVSFPQLVSWFFGINMSLIEDDTYTPCHLLDWVRISWLSITKSSVFSSSGELVNEKSFQHNELRYIRPNLKNNYFSFNHPQEITSPTTTSLYESGIKFQVNKHALSLLDIYFDTHKGILFIPKLKVDDGTECTLRNLIAFEKCHNQWDGSYITDYQFFLDCLINTPMDVQLLTKAGIIENWLGSEKKLSDLINSMGDYAYDFSKGYLYGDIARHLSMYQKKKWHRYMTILKHVYFIHPWAVIGIAYALIILILAIIQTFGSFKD